MLNRHAGQATTDLTTPAALLLAATVGLLVNFNPWGAVQTSDLPTVGLALAALVSALLFPAGREAASWLRWRLAWAGAALLGWLLVSALFSGRVFSALTGSGSGGIGWVVLVLGGAIVLGASSAATSLRSLVREYYAPGVLWVESLFVMYQVTQGQHGAGTLSNSSFLGMLMAMLLPSAVAGLPDKPDRLRAIWHWGAVAVGVLSIAASGSRVALVAALVWLAWLGLEAARRGGRRSRALVVAVAALAVLAIVALVFFAGVEVSVTSVAGSLGDRAAKLEGAWRAGLARPVAGWGPDGFFFGASRTLPVQALEYYGGLGQIATDPHSVLAWTLVSGGFVAVALLGWLLFEIWRNWVRQARSSRPDTAAAWGTALVLLIALTSPIPLQILPLAAIVFGLSLRVERPSRDVVSESRWPALVRAAVVVLALVLAAYAASRLPLGRADRQGQQAPGRLTRSVAALWSFDPFLWYRASLDLGFEAAADPRVAVAQLDLGAIERAVALEPDNAMYRLELARTLAFYGAPRAQVEPEFAKALALFPASAEAHAAWGLYLLALGDKAGAKREMGIALRNESDNAVANDLAAAYYESVGDLNQAAIHRERANQTRRGAIITTNQ